MKFPKYLFSLLILGLLYSCGGTDVPLSYNTRVLNSHVMGFWQISDTSAISCTSNGTGAVYRSYKYDPASDQFIGNDGPYQIYFSNMMIAGTNYQFASVQSGDRAFTNVRYNFNENGNLEIRGINTSLTYANRTTSNSNDYFNTTENFQRYVREKTGQSELYAQPITLTQRYSLAALRKPVRFQYTPTSYYSNISYSNFKPKFGNISFDYPSNWKVGRDDSKNQAYNENHFIQPANQSFSGRNGEVVIRIFDPYCIMEEAKSLSAAFSASLFNKFVGNLSEGVSVNTKTVTINGKTYYECLQSNGGMSVKSVGVRTPNGNLCILSLQEVPNISQENTDILYRVAQSVSGGEPGQYMSQPESVVSNYYKALGRGDEAEVRRLSCSSAQLSNALIDVFLGGSGAGSITGSMVNAGKMFDFSRLRFYSIGGNDKISVVRVCGNIVGPDNSIESFYNYARRLSGSNLFVVRLEEDGWKICEYFR